MTTTTADDVDQGVDIDQVLADVADVARPCAEDGEVKAYIADLAGMEPGNFAICVTELDGETHAMGDLDIRFSIQSISKVLALVLAMRKVGEGVGVQEQLWRRVGREPSGDPFNSLVQLEREQGVPRNPLINAGALIVDDVLLDHCADPKGELLTLASELAGEELTISEEVARVEEDTSARNRAIANLMLSFDNLHHTVDEVLDVYAHQCAIEMSAAQLARAFRFLANDGVDPATDRRILHPDLARRVAAIMLTCGTYDAAGEFAYSIGLPCKSGVCGAIVALAPKQAAICVWSPPLDDKGNSLAGRVALHELSDRLDLSVFKGPESAL
ncbi:MAG: glutaminase [Actinobacteria bacterium]|nr:glutaminase [Actinomycetota bacterium]